jgi:hypothetical protein
VAPAARAEACAATQPATHSKSTTPPPAPATSGHGHHGYLIAVRMGWAI